jgi:hypothetical protein
MSKVNTVNVVEYVNGTLQSVRSFIDNPAGNKEAEALFLACAKDNDFSEEDVETGLEDGILSHSESDYQLFLIHSN